MPPIRIPRHIILTSLGNKLGTGPENTIDITKNIVPNATIFGKLFALSGTKFRINEVIV